MPRYRLYPLGAGAPLDPPLQIVAFNDIAAMRWAMNEAFPQGCDIFLDGRFVARVHGAAPGVIPTGDDPAEGRE